MSTWVPSHEARGRVLDALTRIYRKRGPVRVEVVADRLKQSPHHVREILREVADEGRVVTQRDKNALLYAPAQELS